MTKDPLTLSPNDTVVDAAKIMLDKKYGGIPILEDRKLVGIMTQSDIFRMIVREWS